VADLAATLDIGAGRTVLDLAAGTGKLTRLLVPTGAHVLAVEPSAALRAELTRVVAGCAVELIDGTAEHLPVPDGSADAVVVGQAFHWFDGERALPEIHRVLVPGGGLGMLWNVRDDTVEWVQRLTDLTEPYRKDVPSYRSQQWRRAFEASARFGSLELRTYPFEHEIDADTMVERMSSISWIAVLPDAERGQLLDRVRALFDGMPDRFPVPYHTDLWWCRAR
jgi:SAM-dependent methyltransferase